MAENCVVDYYNQIAADYDHDRFGNTYGQFIDRQERQVLDGLKIAVEGCLDLPCGTGRLTNYAAWGADASEAMLKEARERFPNKEFMLVDAMQTGLEAACVETVLSFHFLMHLDKESVKKVMVEMYRILKPGGRWICDIPSQKRRGLGHREQELWHGNTSLSVQEMSQMARGMFRVESVHGVMLMPVHRFPKALRQPLCAMDYKMANVGWLREWSSYLIFELKK